MSDKGDLSVKTGPADDEALSEIDGAAGIEDLLSPDEDQEEDEANTEPEDGEDPDEGEDDSEDEGAEPEVPAAPDDMVVQLDDGSRITVAELKRNNLFQRDYTRKTTELAERTKGVEAERSRLEEATRTLAQHRDFLLTLYEQQKPVAPDPALIDSDPLGYMRQKEWYDARMGEWNALFHQRQQVEAWTHQQQQEALAKQLAAGRERLNEMLPELKDPARLQTFRNDVFEHGVNAYGFTNDELNSVVDPRYLAVMKDAIAYRKLKAKAPQTQESLKGKPPVLKGSKRNGETQKTRGAKTANEALRKTGSMEAGIAALMNLDL